MPLITCERCGAENIKRHRPARFCIPCSQQRDKDNGAALARSAVQREVAAGRMPRARTLVCVDCGRQATDYDHRDNGKPLDVVPVCRSCNKLRGPAIPA